MIVPNAAYRPDPKRAVFVSGQIDSNLVSRITLDLLKLQAESRQPITVYIDSPGGNVGAMESILRLLRLSDLDASGPCRIITVVTNRAASAATDLLSSGDYALAYPTSAVLYHGVRRHADSLPPLTAEITSLLGQILRLSNDRYAMELAQKIEERFSFRFIMARTVFGQLREQLKKPQLSDVECFFEYINSRLSEDGQAVWGRARERHARYKSLFDTILATAREGTGTLSRAKVEAKRLKAIIDFEVKANRKRADWSFTNGGLDSVANDFFLLNEYLSTAGHERLQKWAQRFYGFVLPKENVATLDAIENDDERAARVVDLVTPILEPLWSFFVALCHALQDGENELTALDSYWLGLVDEVVGESTLISYRSFVEFEPDPPEEATTKP